MKKVMMNRKKGLKILEQIKSQLNKNTLIPAIKVVILMLVVTGIVYPLVLVAIGQSTLTYQSNGSLISINGKEIGRAHV
jgi:K+-transporting ATPase ATPase C chain